MLNLLRKLRTDRTRGQIFFGFIVAMIIVLMLTISVSYLMLSKLQKESAEQYVNEIAVQMSGRLEALLNEVNVLTLHLATDDRIQEMLMEELNGSKPSFDERIAIRKVLLNTSAYSQAIEEIELFSLSNSIYPVVNKSIMERIEKRYVAEADKTLKAGNLVWVGRDPENPNYLVAVRQIRLEKRKYQKGGYLVIRVKPSLIEFTRQDIAEMKGSTMYLLDAEKTDISTEEKNKPLLSIGDIQEKEKDYITVKKRVEETNWTLALLVPKKEVTEGIDFLQTVLVWASILSVILFAILSYYLSLFITSPIKKMTKVMQQAKGGILAENPDHYFNHEINQLNTVYNQMVKQINYLIEAVYEKEIIRSKSEIKALHSQINPHFLFNTLDSLYWSLVSKEEEKLAQFVVTLADLFRYAIQPSGKDGFVSIEEELEQVKRYADIMQMRWDERLQVNIDFDQRAAMCEIPKLTIQPILENAITHGIEPKSAGGIVKLSVKEEEGVVKIIVKDNGIGVEGERLKEIQKRLRNGTSMNSISKGTGIGLFNVHKLLQLHFGQEFGLQIDSHLNKGTTVILRIPSRS
ncbi:two-component system sensor histidine kinase YesM [Bacillus fengqiuensis]|nr:two-component system sensor histidine kinase YesM [Bacillus fengqiuensis]